MELKFQSTYINSDEESRKAAFLVKIEQMLNDWEFEKEMPVQGPAILLSLKRLNQTSRW